MNGHVVSRQHGTPPARPASGAAFAPAPAGWDAPAFEVISLSCEISAYAPDGDDRPLF